MTKSDVVESFLVGQILVMNGGTSFKSPVCGNLRAVEVEEVGATYLPPWPLRHGPGGLLSNLCCTECAD